MGSFESWERKLEVSSKNTMGGSHPVVSPKGIKDTTSKHGDVVGAGNVDKEEEADEVPVVVEPDTVVHPWTVMV
jgi:hypothetical protein